MLVLLSARHDFGSGWALEGSLPIGALRYAANGEDYDERVSGFGNLTLGGEYDFAALWGAGGYRPSLRLGVGLSLPSGTGTTKTAGVVGATAAENVSPTLLRLGSGAFGLGVRLTFSQAVHPRVALFVPLSVVTPLDENPQGLKFGTSLSYGLGLVVRPASMLTLSASFQGSFRDTAVSETMGEIVNSGGHWLSTEVGVGVLATDVLALFVSARVPVWADVNGRQLTETVTLSAGLTFKFGADDDDEHDHGEGDQHDHDAHDHDAHEGHDQPRGDVTDLAAGGASFALDAARVPGKVSVVDFWADWCAPCKVIMAGLGGLAASYPNLAIRRVEVPDFDSPVAREHLPDETALPLLWVIGPDGERLATLRGKPAEVLRAVQEIMERHR